MILGLSFSVGMPNSILSGILELFHGLHEEIDRRRNFKFFQKILPELLPEHKGEYVIIQGRKVHGFAGNFSDANTRGFGIFKSRPFLVEPVVRKLLEKRKIIKWPSGPCVIG